PMIKLSFWVLVTGSLWLMALVNTDILLVDWALIDVRVFLGIAYLSVFTTIITFFLFQYCTVRIGPTRVMSYTYLNPALVLVTGLLLGESAPPFSVFIGVALSVVSTALLQKC
ncbi:MAG: EamA family transporter, partial [bacterium]|nr:EamA family transporter [bacterium]